MHFLTKCIFRLQSFYFANDQGLGIRITPSDQRDRGEGPPASNPLRCYDQGPGARPERIHLEMVPSVGPRSRLRIPVSMAETKVCLVSHIRWEGLRL